ncbi:MAG: hypothetical protein H6766_03160 [Candidatus Peribacteria bacterium]|nr:MAG: hypothetical protein H6766_03160 [Candidatus Peribacteria bacterium]
MATTVAVTYLIAANFLLSGIIWLIMAFHKRA